MNRLYAALFALCGAIAFAAPALSQCPITTISATTIGRGCNTGPVGCCLRPSAPTNLRASLSVSTCTVALDVDAVVGCCGVDAPVSIVGIGFAPAAVPVPPLGTNCTLHVQVAVSAATSGRRLRLPLLGVGPITFFAQAVTLHTAPNVPNTLTLSNALAVTMR